MFDNVFYFILNTSIMAAFIVVFLLITRTLLGRWIPKSLIYALWGIVILRFIIPISISSKFSLINFVSPYIAKSIAIPKAYNSMSELPPTTVTNLVQSAEEYFPIRYKSDIAETFFNVSSVVWIVGMLIFMALTLVIYTMTVKRLNTAILMRDNNNILKSCINKLKVKEDVRVFESSLINTPIVIGIIKPRIIVPKGISIKALKYVLMHELSHIKRKDNLLKLLSILAVCIHWFNPFAWLFLYISGRDMEIACDEHVLKNIQYNKRKNYATTLAELAEKQRIPFAALGSTAVKERIMNIASYRRIPIVMLFITSILCMIIAIALITNPIIVP